MELYKSFTKLIEGKNELLSSKGLKIHMYSPVLDELVLDEVMGEDIIWFIASVIFAFVWILLHTNSFFVSLVACAVLVLTFPVGTVICEGIF